MEQDHSTAAKPPQLACLFSIITTPLPEKTVNTMQGQRQVQKQKQELGRGKGRGQEPRECNARSETTAMSAAREWQGYSYRHRIDLRDGLALRHVPSYQWRKGLTA